MHIHYCLHCSKVIYQKGLGERKYCSNQCQMTQQSKDWYTYFLTTPKEYQTAEYNPHHTKPYIIVEQNNICSICGTSQIHNNLPLIFILDHIDGNASNNDRKNLRCICPNCDSQLHTYKARNIGRGTRKYIPRVQARVAKQ